MAHRLVERLQRMLAGTPAPAERIELLSELARQHARILDFESARQALTRAQELLDTTPLPACSDDVRYATATILYISGQLQAAMAELNAARAAAVAAGHTHWIARCDALMALFLTRFGALDAAREFSRRARDAAMPIDDAQALYTAWLAVGAMARTDCDGPTARQAYARARHYAGMLDDDLAVRTVLQHLVGLTIERARNGLLTEAELPGARAEVATALMFAEHNESRVGTLQARIALAMLERASGRPADATRALPELVAQASALVLYEEAIIGRIELARAHLAVGATENAVLAARAAVEQAERSGILRLQSIAVDAAVALYQQAGRDADCADLQSRAHSLRKRVAQQQHESQDDLRDLIGDAAHRSRT